MQLDEMYVNQLERLNQHQLYQEQQVNNTINNKKEDLMIYDTEDIFNDMNEFIALDAYDITPYELNDLEMGTSFPWSSCKSDQSKSPSPAALNYIELKLPVSDQWDQYWNQISLKEQAMLADANCEYINGECSICKFKLPSLHAYEEHCLINHIKARYECSDCGACHTTRQGVVEHLSLCIPRLQSNSPPAKLKQRKAPNAKLQQCAKCGMKLKLDNLETHCLNCTSTQQAEKYERKEKINEALTKLNYRCIQTVVDFKKQFVCSVCNRAFGCKGECNRHAANVHTGVRYKCPECPKTTSCPGSLRRHMDSYHKPTSLRQQCMLCEKLFASQESLAKHQRARCKFRSQHA